MGKWVGPEARGLESEAEVVGGAPCPSVTSMAVELEPATDAGATRKKNLNHVSDDPTLLWKVAVAGRCSRLAFKPDTDFLDAQAKQYEHAMNEPDPVTKELPFPGVRAEDFGKLASTGRR